MHVAISISWLLSLLTKECGINRGEFWFFFLSFSAHECPFSIFQTCFSFSFFSQYIALSFRKEGKAYFLYGIQVHCTYCTYLEFELEQVKSRIESVVVVRQVLWNSWKRGKTNRSGITHLAHEHVSLCMFPNLVLQTIICTAATLSP